MTTPEIPWAGPPLLPDADVIAILREARHHPDMHASDGDAIAHLPNCPTARAVRMAYAKGLGEAHHDEAAYDALMQRLMANIGEDWEAGEGSAESILIDYVRALEHRVKALGGNTAAHDGGQHAALGEFYALARRFVANRGYGVDDMRRAWNEYKRIRKEAQ